MNSLLFVNTFSTLKSNLNCTRTGKLVRFINWKTSKSRTLSFPNDQLRDRTYLMS